MFTRREFFCSLAALAVVVGAGLPIGVRGRVERGLLLTERQRTNHTLYSDTFQVMRVWYWDRRLPDSTLMRLSA